MKRLIGFMVIFMLAMFLAACSDESETRTFEMEQNGIETTMVYTVKGDKVTKQTTENIIKYDSAGITSKEQAEELLNPIIQEFQNIEGLTHTIEYEDSQAIETLAIDYEVVNFDDIKNLPGMNFNGDTDNGVSMKKSLEILETQGFKEVK